MSPTVRVCLALLLFTMKRADHARYVSTGNKLCGWAEQVPSERGCCERDTGRSHVRADSGPRGYAHRGTCRNLQTTWQLKIGMIVKFGDRCVPRRKLAVIARTSAIRLYSGIPGSHISTARLRMKRNERKAWHSNSRSSMALARRRTRLKRPGVLINHDAYTPRLAEDI